MLKALGFFLYTPLPYMTYVSILLGTLFPKEFAKFVFFYVFLIWGTDSYWSLNSSQVLFSSFFEKSSNKQFPFLNSETSYMQKGRSALARKYFSDQVILFTNQNLSEGDNYEDETFCINDCSFIIC
jgi:hypothetical protein